LKTKNIIEGLQILLPFYDNQDGFHNGAEHDAFYAYATEKPLTDEALGKMIALGWFQEDVAPTDHDFSKSDYSPDDGWTCYV